MVHAILDVYAHAIYLSSDYHRPAVPGICRFSGCWDRVLLHPKTQISRSVFFACANAGGPRRGRWFVGLGLSGRSNVRSDIGFALLGLCIWIAPRRTVGIPRWYWVGTFSES